MKFVFSHAKNNELTFSIDNKYFHSAYNPSSEAEKWVNQMDCNFIPKAIIVLGIGLPYCINYLKKKFYNTKNHPVICCDEAFSFRTSFRTIYYRVVLNFKISGKRVLKIA